MTNTIALQGRVIAVRKHKFVVFIDLDSPTQGRIQLCYKPDIMQDVIPSKGAIILATGSLGTTQTGQRTLFVENADVLNVSIMPEAVNQDMKRLLLIRGKMESIARSILEKHGAVAVDTNILGPYKGTSQITPFETVDNKSKPYYMKITHELELKRMVLDTQMPVYEIGRVFRNMGQDARHHHEYKVLEAQFPYTSLSECMQIVQEIMQPIGRLFGKNDFDIIPTYKVKEKFKELGYNFDSLTEKEQKHIHKTKIKTQVGPFFLTNPPAAWSPLTLRDNDGQTALDADLVYNGKGISHICAERYKYEDIKAGLLNGAARHSDADQDFLNHMKGALPPTTGFALGLDRILSIFMNAKRIKDVIPYSR